MFFTFFWCAGDSWVEFLRANTLAVELGTADCAKDGNLEHAGALLQNKYEDETFGKEAVSASGTPVQAINKSKVSV